MDPTSQFRVRHHWLVIAGLLLIACSPKSGGIEKYSSSLDPAIELFVEGKYAEAVSRLEELTGRVRSDEGLVEVYLYLGRAYLALEQYDRAIDAFTAGASYGGAGPFREYLMRLSRIKESSPANIAKAEKITRAQLALTIDRLVYRTDQDFNDDSSGAASGGAGESESVRRGVLMTLPDGDFHGGEFVTRAAFYSIVCRLLGRESASAASGRIFPNGFEWVTKNGPGDKIFVSGKEAVTILERIAALEESPHGG